MANLWIKRDIPDRIHFGPGFFLSLRLRETSGLRPATVRGLSGLLPRSIRSLLFFVILIDISSSVWLSGKFTVLKKTAFH